MKNMMESRIFSLGTGSWDKQQENESSSEGTKFFTEMNTGPADISYNYVVERSGKDYGGTTAYRVLLKTSSLANA